MVHNTNFRPVKPARLPDVLIADVAVFSEILFLRGVFALALVVDVAVAVAVADATLPLRRVRVFDTPDIFYYIHIFFSLYTPLHEGAIIVGF